MEFVGRAEELAALGAVLDRAISYQAPQLVTIIGSPGIGKSRLVAEWLRRVLLRPEPVRVYRGRAAPGASDEGLFARLVRERFQLAPGEEPAAAASRLRDELARIFVDRRVNEVAHFLGAFVHLPVRDSPFLRAVAEDPRQHDQIARMVLRRFLEVDAERAPVVLAFDDVQCADPGEQELLRELGDGLSGSPVVLVALARPDLLVRQPAWRSHEGDHTRIELRGLDAAAALLLLRSQLGPIEVADSILTEAIEMTGGNPLFLTEFAGRFQADGGAEAARALLAPLPITVEQAIEARVAALAPAERDLLEKAAVLGNVFWVGALLVLGRLAHDPREGARSTFAHDGAYGDIERILDDLVDRDYVLAIPDPSIPGEREYCFKHNLERELVAEMTDPALAHSYHLVAAQWLETRLGEGTEEQLDFVAGLYERGSDARRAAALLVLAADKARARYANESAMSYYQRAIGLLGADDSLGRIDALHNLGDVCALVGQHERALDCFRQMLEQAWLLDLAGKGGAANDRIGRLYRQRGELDRAREHLDAALELFRKAGDRRGISAALDDLGKLSWMRGDYEEALTACGDALALRRDIGDPRSIALSLSNVGRIQYDRGDFEAALTSFDEALALRRKIEDRPGQIRSLHEAGRVYSALGDLERAGVLYERGHKLACDIGDLAAQAQLLLELGQARLSAGNTARAADSVGLAAELAVSLGDRLLQSECSRVLAETFLVIGDVMAAREHCERALDLAQSSGSRTQGAAAVRVLAQVTAAVSWEAGEIAAASALYERAISEFAGVGNQPELAHAYLRFADFQDRMGSPVEAQKLRAQADQVSDRLRTAARHHLVASS